MDGDQPSLLNDSQQHNEEGHGDYETSQKREASDFIYIKSFPLTQVRQSRLPEAEIAKVSIHIS